jgi:hypothetical protein
MLTLASASGPKTEANTPVAMNAKLPSKAMSRQPRSTRSAWRCAARYAAGNSDGE